MEQLFLVKPSLDWAEEILSYKKSFAAEHLYGGNQLETTDSVSDWLAHLEITSSYETCAKDRSPSTTFLCIRQSDRSMVGICNIRHDLNQDFLFNSAGHIGYSVKPGERRKGYASEQLRLALLEAQKLGITRVLITAADWNIGSQKTILANGGQYENTFHDNLKNENMRRYWIDNE